MLDSLNPDLLILDGFQPWAPELASSRKITAIHFLVVGSASISFFYHHYLYAGTRNFPFSGIFLKDYEAKQLQLTPEMNNSIGPNVAFNGVEKSNEIILINTCNEIEGKYVDYLSTLSKKKVILVEEIEEIDHSLELTQLNFIWVLRFPLGEETNIENVLPKGFLDRVQEKRVIVEKWAPQARILEHVSVGGLLCHCGWNSILESLHFGVPLITMPMHLDQYTHSRMAVELGTASSFPNYGANAFFLRMFKHRGVQFPSSSISLKDYEISKLRRVESSSNHGEEKDRLFDCIEQSTEIILINGSGDHTGMAPQARILAHSSIGGFVSHCGWSSVMESINFGVPIIATPLQFNQYINARQVELVGVGVEVIKT
ncbi:hypothetical protein K7X08_008549 [Anisodus acutangulus]|uniref:UDP-glycosyltransferases domain-containing protein n=1 Tax=Anisodus acutangulus TaxID=402998 RepID=A0A9Q1RQ36_9SOLA|nr:hypothetical protein K7X08_008549 [Anisodus acutangulus]